MYLNNIPTQTYASTFEEATQLAKEIFKAALIPIEGGTGWVCPVCGNGLGDSKTGITEVKSSPNHFTCFKSSCFASSQGLSGDVFDLVANYYNLQHGSAEAMQKTNDLLNIKIDRKAAKNRGTASESILDKAIREAREHRMAEEAAKSEQEAAKQLKAIAAFYALAHKTLLETPNAGWNYLIDRGLTPETIRNSPYLGYCPHWRPLNKPNATKSARVILGRSEGTYLARAIDPNNRYPKLVDGSASDFLTLNFSDETRVVWVVEGEIDAYAMLPYVLDCCDTMGIVALGSTTNATRVAEWLAERYSPTDPHTFFLSLDADEAGKSATNIMRKLLCRYNVALCDLLLMYRGEKDPADAVKYNKDLFGSAIATQITRYSLAFRTEDSYVQPQLTEGITSDKQSKPEIKQSKPETDEKEYSGFTAKEYEYMLKHQDEPIDLFGEHPYSWGYSDSVKVKLKDHLESTCSCCPSIQAVKEGAKSPQEHCKTCQSCRKNLKGYATLLAFGGTNLLENEFVPEELEQSAEAERSFVPRKTPHPKGKTATYRRRYEKVIRSKFAEGKKPNRIAKELGISPTTVCRLFDELGLPRRKK